MTRRRNFRVEVLEDRVNPVTMFALTNANTLLTFDSATPGTIDNTVAITGLQPTELVTGIDVRPATGQLYGLGLVDDGATRTARVYTIDPATGAATQVGGAPWTVAYPDTAAEFGGFNFNPNVDRIRVIHRSGLNVRLNPNNGALAGTDTNTSQTGLNGVSYTNNDGFSQTTTLFGLNFSDDDLVTVGGLNGVPSPNGGQVFTVGDTGFVAAFAYGFEVTSSNGVAAAFATARQAGTTNLYTVNLTTGALTSVGAIGGNPSILSLTAALNTITVAGTGGNDTLVVNATGPDSGEYILNGGMPVPFTGIESFSFLGGDGDDQFQINNPVGGLFVPSNGIIFHGGIGTNTLFNEGGQAFNGQGSYTPSNATDGTLFHNNPISQLITFTGLTTVTDTVDDTFGFFVNATLADTINVVDGQAGGLLQVNTGGTPAFPVLNFGVKPSTTIDAGDGDNAVAVNFTDLTTGMGSITVLTGVGADTVFVQSTTIQTNFATGAGNDGIQFGDGADLSGGVFDGGADADFVSYAAYTTPVAVNLGLGVAGLSSVLNGSQEVPSNGTAATGTATLSNYDAVTKTFDLTLTVTGLDPADVLGLHLHRGGVGVNGPVILDLLALGTLTPVGTGFTLTLVGLDLDATLLGGRANEAAFLGGQTYLNIHTAAFPGGVIRGQIFSTGNVSLPDGTATGTGGVSNVEEIDGGSAADSLVGSFAANFFDGGAGNDTILGGPGADTFFGGADNDTMIWSNGDGSDVMDGGTGNDTVAVNGNLTADDVFTIGANGTRVAFARTSPGPFTLDIGTTETLRVNGGAGGNDKFTVASLSAVADLSPVLLFGLGGNDTFDVTPSAVAVGVNGGTGTDDLTLTDGGETGDFVTIAADPAGGVTGGLTFSNRAAVDFAQIDPPANPSNILTVTATDGLTTTPAGSTVTYTITVTNNESVGINGIAVSAAFPAALTGITWTAAFTGAGSNGAANGTGNIAETVGLAAGGTVTYTVTGTLTATFSGTLTTTATASVPAALTDNNLADNSATDVTTVLPQPTPLVVSGAANGTALAFVPTGGTYPTTPTATLSPFSGIAATVRTATGDVNGDGIDDVIAVTGPGVPIRVAVISGADNTTVLVAPFAPFAGSEDFTGGGFVSAGDIDGDGKDEFVVTPDQGGGPRVSIFSRNADGSTALRANFFGIDDENFRGGARSALGDVDGDGKLDLAVAAGFLGGPRTALFKGTTLLGTPTRLIPDFFAFPGQDAVNLRNGVFVAAGDVDGDGKAELIFGGGPGGAPRVFILSGAKIAAGDVGGAQAAPVANFFVAGNANDRGGVRLAATDADGDNKADVAAGSGEGSPSKVRVYLGTNFAGGGEPATFQDLDPFAATLPGGVFVG